MGEPIAADNNNENRADETQSSSAYSDQNGTLNGLGNCKNSINLNLNKPTPDLDYLTQLLKDKKQLVAFPNVFSHVERLLDDEISRVRVILFQCKFTRESLQIPEAIGEVIMRQEKIFVPVKNHPDYNFVGRILGPRGMTAKQLENETGCKIMVRGKGSMRDKKKEDMNRGKANWEHLQEELHVLIQCEDTPNRIEIKIKRAIEEVNKLLIPSPEGEDELKKKQLMELAIINGTYRTASNSAAQNGQSQAALAAAAVAAAAAASGKPNAFLNIDQRLLAGFALPTAVFPNVTATNGTLQSPGLAGAPLIMQQNNNNQQNNQTGRVSVTNGISPVGAIPVSNSQTNVANLAAAAAFQMQMNGIVNPAAQMLAQQVPGLNLTQTTASSATNMIQNQAAVDYQVLLNSMQYDQTAALAQLQQQQQLAALMQASNANALNANNTQNVLVNGAVNGFNNYSAAAAAAAAAAGLSQSFNINGQTTGSILAQQRRFLGQSRDHPYLKREST